MGCFDRIPTGLPDDFPVPNCTWKDLEQQWREPYPGKFCCEHEGLRLYLLQAVLRGI